MSPKICVIVPIYNVEPYLRSCLDSLLAQTCSDAEFILVDDGATDSCGAICEEYAARDGRFRVIHKENGGLVSARKAGLQEARGEYVTYVDGDDSVEPELLAQCMEAIVRYGGVDVLLHGYIKDSETQQVMQSPMESGCYEGEKLDTIGNDIESEIASVIEELFNSRFEED